MNVICIGEALIDFVCTDTRGDQQGTVFVKKPGGAPANVAACIGRLGGKASFVGAVGNDPFGDYLANTLQSAGVDITNMQRTETPTTLAFVTLFEDGDREFVFNRGADACLRLSATDIFALSATGIFHFGSATVLLGGESFESYFALANAARDKGHLICFDPNYRVDLWQSDVGQFRHHCDQFFTLADIVKVSEEELALLTQTDSLEEGCELLHDKGVFAVFVTLGSLGCLMSVNHQRCIVPAYEINAIDTTGAGDAFIGALLYQLSKNANWQMQTFEQWQQCVRFAEKVSAAVCTTIGAMSALPTLQEVQTLSLKEKAIS